MGQAENEANQKNGAGDLKRQAYSKPRLQVFGDLKTIIRGQGNTDPTSNDAPSQHHRSQ